MEKWSEMALYYLMLNVLKMTDLMYIFKKWGMF